MSIFCILALDKNSLIRLTLANLFGNSEDELTVIESEAQDRAELLSELDHHDAQVILLENSSPLADEPFLTHLLLLHPNLLVVIIQEDNNWLHIYRKESHLLTSAADLLDVIRSTQDHSF